MTPTKLKKHRKTLDLTQEELGEQLELTGRTIRSYEAGEESVPKWLEYAVLHLLKK
jgi:DNA-binding XRE family transcriptional regulator